MAKQYFLGHHDFVFHRILMKKERIFDRFSNYYSKPYNNTRNVFFFRLKKHIEKLVMIIIKI